LFYLFPNFGYPIPWKYDSARISKPSVIV